MYYIYIVLYTSKRLFLYPGMIIIMNDYCRGLMQENARVVKSTVAILG